MPMPKGSHFLVEVFKAKLGAIKKPMMGSDGLFVADNLTVYTAMEKQPGWGKDFSEILRNGDWNYAVFKADKTRIGSVNQTTCLACHKPLAKDSYVFSLKQLTESGVKIRYTHRLRHHHGRGPGRIARGCHWARA